MPTDYDQIRQDNILEYGQGTRHLSFLGRLYTDRTHFVFELLQNAEDAGATRILFALFDDRLVVAHDGRLFNERDVKGVCGVGEGTKAEDLTQIGKFGIGFKSVYAYTATPEVHSGDECFKIENYVRPVKADSRPAVDSMTTLFVFPFDSEEIAPETACKEIADRLRTLSARTLLFLRSINEIEYRLPNETEEGSYLREENARGHARQVSVIGQNNDDDEEESWLIFERSVSVPGNAETVRVEVGFLLEAEEPAEKNSELIVKVKDSPLVVYFPTEKATRFGFLIQGPYRTTPSRDNIPKDDEWNKTLVKETAELIGDILPEIKSLGLLSVSFLEALPIRTEDFPDDGMFHPIVESVRDALRNGALLPADDGSFVSAGNAKLARGADLRKMLSQVQLGQLFQSTVTMKWLAGDITQDRTPDLRAYLLKTLAVEEIDPESFAKRVTESFLSLQPELWFVDFYKYLNSQEALWRAPRWERDPGGILRSKPILRLADGSQDVAFKSDGITPNVFLPPTEEAALPVVSRPVVADEQARKFLERLGLSAPDVFDGIVERVLPKYADTDGGSVPYAEHQEDVLKIVRAMASGSDAGKRKVIQAAMRTPFLKATNPMGETVFKKPTEIYLDTAELQRYFTGVQDAWFLDDEYSSSDMDVGIWYDLGLSRLPRKLPISDGLPIEEREHTTRDDTIENFDMDGLEHFLEAIRVIRDVEEQKNAASVLWGFLRDYLASDARFFKARYQWFYYSSQSKYFSSMILVRLKSSKWIPTKDGSLEKPGEIGTHRLLDEFLGDTELVESLGIGRTEDDRKREHAIGLGVSLEDIEFLKNHRDEVEQLKAALDARKELPTFPAKPVANPDRRQERLGEQLTDASDKEYEKRERSVRISSGDIDPTTWLRSQYTNDAGQMVCQICKEEMPFRKRDKSYYFEKKEVLSRRYLPKEHEAQYLALCPLCAAKYEEFVKTDDEAMSGLRAAIGRAKDCDIPISLGDEQTEIRFVETHLHDLKVIMDGAELRGGS